MIAAAAALLVPSACTAAPPDPRAAEGGPISSLPPCDQEVAPAVDEQVDGLDLPDEALLQTVERGDPLVTVTGYVPWTPVQVRQYYGDAEDLEILTLEDEIYEAEVLFSLDGRRTYLRALATCDQGSNLLAVVAPTLDADGLPVPAGRAPSGAP